MTDVERDPVVRRAIEELQRIPPADAAAIRRVVAAAAAARVAPSDDELSHPKRSVSGRYWVIDGVAAAAVVAAISLVRGPSTPARPAGPTSNPAVAATSAPAQMNNLQPVTNSAVEVLPVPKQFVFSSKTAQRVSLVGDFNNWSADRARMTRSPDGALWSVTIPVIPGRHMYGFMVDDSVFMLDPRAPKTRDPDLGTNASVVVVGKP